MSIVPPSWAFGGLGIGSAEDPHLAKGVHLRVMIAPELGLPVCPMVVYRLGGDEASHSLAYLSSTDVAWVDSHGQVLTLPFEVKPGNPVTGTLLRKPGEQAIAVAVAGGSHKPVIERVVLPKDTTLHMQVFISSPAGPRTIGQRSEAPHYFAAPQIDGVVLSGSGIVHGAVWIKASVERVKLREPAFLMDLPVAQADRYQGLPDAKDRAKDRVVRGAPQRFGLHDDPSVAGPTSAAPAGPNDEWQRVEALAHDLLPYLKTVVADMSAQPQALRLTQALSEGVVTGADASAAVACLQAVLAGSADPGVARWLGLMETDVHPTALAGPFTLYFIRAFIPVNPAFLSPTQLLSLVASGGWLTDDLHVPGLAKPVPQVSADGMPVFDWMVPVLVFPNHPPSRPAAPHVGAPLAPEQQVGPSGTMPLATGDALGTWVADAVPPDARRELTLPLAALEAAPTLAFARKDPSGLVALNTKHPVSGRALGLVPAIPENASTTGTGHLTDNTAPPDKVTYFVAQADWFGRWSAWAVRSVPSKPRTRPPAPVFTLVYVPAAAEPVDDAPRFGRLVARIIVPRPEDLAAGARPLVGARVYGTVGGVSVSASRNLPAGPVSHLEIEIAGPPGLLPRAGNAVAEIDAEWTDGVNFGDPGQRQRQTLVDPRPPPAIELDPSLRYSARPDAVGRSQIVLSWPSHSNRRYRVYNSDETRLRAAMADIAGSTPLAATLLAALAAAENAADRGAVWTAPQFASLFTRDLFTNLTATPLDGTGTTLRFPHDLSGALTVLSFFKVVALSSDNSESPFTAATLLPVAVPSGGPPPRPLLDFVEFDATGAAVLRVTAVRGPQPAEHWRLRRSIATSEDALRMPQVATGTVPSLPGEGPAVFDIVDAGVPAWTRASWRVEVQAPSPPGSMLAGEWSPASGAVSAMRVPPPPAAPTQLTLGPTQLTFKHPEDLPRGAMGGYRFELYCQRPGEREDRVLAALADDPQVVSGSGNLREFRVEVDASAPV